MTLGYAPYRRIQSRRFACCTSPGWFRAAARAIHARRDGWRIVDLLRPTGQWRGRWCCLFLERIPKEHPTP